MENEKLRKSILDKRAELAKIMDENTGYAISEKTGFGRPLIYRLKKGERNLKIETVLDLLDAWYK